MKRLKEMKYEIYGHSEGINGTHDFLVYVNDRKDLTFETQVVNGKCLCIYGAIGEDGYFEVKEKYHEDLKWVIQNYINDNYDDFDNEQEEREYYENLTNEKY